MADAFGKGNFSCGECERKKTMVDDGKNFEGVDMYSQSSHKFVEGITYLNSNSRRINNKKLYGSTQIELRPTGVRELNIFTVDN